MTCFSPLQGFESCEVTSRGKRKTTFNRSRARAGGLFKRNVPCNRCSGCRIDYSRQWAIRCHHESTLHSDNSFITLTYNDDFIPLFGSLNYVHWTNFMKRLRRAIEPLKIRFYMGPEYGDLNLRPHYHALIFGYDFPDKVFYSQRGDNRLYRSKLLEDCWTDPISGRSMGYCSVGSCTLESAAYVARYMMKKVKGEDFDNRYSRVNLITGEVVFVAPERARMSNRNGIGKDWFDLFYLSDCYNKDFITLNGRKYRPPKYYDALLERISPEMLASIKEARVDSMRSNASDFTPQRLAVREQCHLASVKLLQRSIYSNGVPE